MQGEESPANGLVASITNIRTDSAPTERNRVEKGEAHVTIRLLKTNRSEAKLPLRRRHKAGQPSPAGRLQDLKKHAQHHVLQYPLYLTWRTLALALEIRSTEDLVLAGELIEEACARIRGGSHDVERDNDYFARSRQASDE